ncbi:hypothetical protein Tco_0638601, partial [Tanacetum coccineum]
VPECSKGEVQDVGETDFLKVAATDVIDASKDVPVCSKGKVQDVGETDVSKVAAIDVTDVGKEISSSEDISSDKGFPFSSDECFPFSSDEGFPFSAREDISSGNPLSVSNDSDSSIYLPKSANKKKKPSKQIASSKASTPKPSSSKPSSSKPSASGKRDYKKISMTGCILFIRAPNTPVQEVVKKRDSNILIS